MCDPNRKKHKGENAYTYYISPKLFWEYTGVLLDGQEEGRRISNWKTDLTAAAVAAVLYLSIPGELSRVQSMIYIALYYALPRLR